MIKTPHDALIFVANLKEGYVFILTTAHFVRRCSISTWLGTVPQKSMSSRILNLSDPDKEAS